ncbi:hypothetical protein GCM10009744_40660 [Kribbella alba]|uniref:DUF4394 domain-containing protein n=1 Tax=Kribbella alba TaxID=190197 RepID=A0ABN2FH83_9ACTN
MVAGRVDAKHNRAAVLLRAMVGNADSVLPVELANGTTGTPILADGNGKTQAGTYSLLDIDQSTGNVFLGKIATAIICLGGVPPARVDLDTGTVTTSESVSACGHGIVSDGAGTLYNLAAGSVSTKLAPTTTLTPYDEAGQTTGNGFALRRGTPSSLAVDGVHHLALVVLRSRGHRVLRFTAGRRSGQQRDEPDLGRRPHHRTADPDPERLHRHQPRRPPPARHPGPIHPTRPDHPHRLDLQPGRHPDPAVLVLMTPS